MKFLSDLGLAPRAPRNARPVVLADASGASKKNHQRKKTNIPGGWPVAAMILLAIEAPLVLATFALAIFAWASSPSRAMLPPLTCSSLHGAEVGLRLAVNLAASIALASANFFMQIVVAPTREDVDKAHAKGSWLDIATPSLRNLVFVPKINALIWFLLAASSVPMHWMFNSIFLRRFEMEVWSTWEYPPSSADDERPPAPKPSTAANAISCRIEIVHPFLVAVAFLWVFKFLLSVCILVSMRRWPLLVTLGDAIKSFISLPDSTTLGMCSYGKDDFKIKSTGDWKPQSPPPDWTRPAGRYWSAIRLCVWTMSYVPIVASIAIVAALLAISITGKSNMFTENADSSRSAVPLPAVQTLLANMPQLIMSICYLSYNELFTRMFTEREWAKFSVSYEPLRVSDPKGEQWSSLHLQLPLSCSIPVFVLWTCSHWVLSNSVYPAVYSHSATYTTMYAYDFTQSAIIAALVLCLFAASLPLDMGMTWLPGHMVVLGNTSAVVSAACHCMPYSTTDNANTRMVQWHGFYCRCGSCQNSDSQAETTEAPEGEDVLKKITEGTVKWGVITELPLRELRYSPMQLAHLAFGTPAQNVTKPKDGEMYAGM